MILDKKDIMSVTQIFKNGKLTGNYTSGNYTSLSGERRCPLKWGCVALLSMENH